MEETGRSDGIARGMAERAGKIGEVVRLISDIASQTNLLALNATIEAGTLRGRVDTFLAKIRAA